MIESVLDAVKPPPPPANVFLPVTRGAQLFIFLISRRNYS